MKSQALAGLRFTAGKKEDKEFAKQVDEALHEGRILVNESAESQLMQAIRDRNITAIIFWLKNNDPRYSERLEITAHLKQPAEELTPEQEELFRQALQLAPQYLPAQHEEKINGKD